MLKEHFIDEATHHLQAWSARLDAVEARVQATAGGREQDFESDLLALRRRRTRLQSLLNEARNTDQPAVVERLRQDFDRVCEEFRVEVTKVDARLH